MRYYNAVACLSRFVQVSTPDSERNIKKRFKSLLIFAGRGIHTTLNQFRSLWPVKFMSVESTYYAAVALFALLENLEDEQNIKAFEDILVSLRTFVRRWLFVTEIYQLRFFCHIRLTTVFPSVISPVRILCLRLLVVGSKPRHNTFYKVPLPLYGHCCKVVSSGSDCTYERMNEDTTKKGCVSVKPHCDASNHAQKKQRIPTTSSFTGGCVKNGIWPL